MVDFEESQHHGFDFTNPTHLHLSVHFCTIKHLLLALVLKKQLEKSSVFCLRASDSVHCTVVGNYINTNPV